ncbi:MAG: thioredoxin family protein [Planctomycetota bacterium]|nr:thioredoxin family protein [Planctomycetota bacterium]
MKPLEDDSMFDELRRFARGAMSSAETEQIRERMRLDPEFARAANEFVDVWNATASGLGLVAASRTSFEEIVERAGLEGTRRRGLRRRVAAAAFVAVGLSAAAWFAWKPAVPRVVELHTIPWSPNPPIVPENKALPTLLADWSPVQDGHIRWLESMDEARAISAAVSRPIFVYGYIDSCPICKGFEANEFQDPEVLALLDHVIPVRIDLLKLDEEEAEAIYKRRYPLLEMQNERGEIMHTFPGTFAAVDMQAELASAATGLAVPNWRLVHDLVMTYSKARAAEENGRLVEAASAFGTLTENRELPQFAEIGTAGLSRLGSAAAQLIVEARSRSPKDDANALAQFEAESKRFAGTPFESDLSAVLKAWRARGRFPELTVQK